MQNETAIDYLNLLNQELPEIEDTGISLSSRSVRNVADMEALQAWLGEQG